MTRDVHIARAKRIYRVKLRSKRIAATFVRPERKRLFRDALPEEASISRVYHGDISHMRVCVRPSMERYTRGSSSRFARALINARASCSAASADKGGAKARNDSPPVI